MWAGAAGRPLTARLEAQQIAAQPPPLSKAIRRVGPAKPGRLRRQIAARKRALFSLLPEPRSLRFVIVIIEEPDIRFLRLLWRPLVPFGHPLQPFGLLKHSGLLGGSGGLCGLRFLLLSSLLHQGRLSLL